MACSPTSPTSKFDSLRVLGEVGVPSVSYSTVKRRLPAYAEASWRQELAKACAAHAALGPASLVLYDVSTLYFETHTGDGLREPGFSKERRLEPQITIGLITDATGFPLALEAFEGTCDVDPAETALAVRAGRASCRRSGQSPRRARQRRPAAARRLTLPSGWGPIDGCPWARSTVPSRCVRPHLEQATARDLPSPQQRW